MKTIVVWVLVIVMQDASHGSPATIVVDNIATPRDCELVKGAILQLGNPLSYSVGESGRCIAVRKAVMN